MAAPATGDPRVHLRLLRRKRCSVVVPLTQYPGRVQVFKQVLAPRKPKLVTHRGYEWLYVLAGKSASTSENASSPSVQAGWPSSTPANRTGSAPAGANAAEILAGAAVLPMPCSCDSSCGAPDRPGRLGVRLMRGPGRWSPADGR